MKSEKAKELIEKYAVGNSRNEAPTMLKRTAILCVEKAEQEAEERVRKKAIEAFKKMCVFRDRRCKPNCKGCSSVRHFTNELDE